MFECREKKRECERSGTIHTLWELNPRPDHPHPIIEEAIHKCVNTVLAQISSQAPVLAATYTSCHVCFGVYILQVNK